MSVDACDEETGRSALMYAAAVDHLEAVQLLIEHKAAVDREDEEGATALTLAASGNKLDVAQFLIEHKATVDKLDSIEWSRLHTACYCGYDKMAALLLDNGAQLNALTKQGDTALILATFFNKPNCVKVLLERKADTTVKATDGRDAGKTALDIATAKRFREIASMLEAASTAAPPPAPPAPRVDLVTPAATRADKADEKTQHLVREFRAGLRQLIVCSDVGRCGES